MILVEGGGDRTSMGRFVQFNPPDPVRPFNLSARPFPLVLSSNTGTGTEKGRGKK